MSTTTTQPAKGGPRRPGTSSSPVAAFPKTRLEAARIAAGYAGPQGLARFARRVRRHPRYVRSIELHGNAPDLYAEEAHRILRCDKTLFLYPNWVRDTDTRSHLSGEISPVTLGEEAPVKDAGQTLSTYSKPTSSASPVGAGGRDQATTFLSEVVPTH